MISYPKDPAATVERLYIREQELRELAAEADERGWKSSAKSWRRQAAACKAARTRIAKVEGWV